MATTPIRAIPYPVGTDRVMDGDNAIQAVATKIDPGMPRVGITCHTGAAVTANSGGYNANFTTVVEEVGGDHGPGTGTTPVVFSLTGLWLVEYSVTTLFSMGGRIFMDINHLTAADATVRIHRLPIVPGFNEDSASLTALIRPAVGEKIRCGLYAASGSLINFQAYLQAYQIGA